MSEVTVSRKGKRQMPEEAVGKKLGFIIERRMKTDEMR
jgi:hypothetical protein